MDEQDQVAGHSIKGFNPYVLFGQGFNLGCADLIQGGSFREVIGRIVAVLLLHGVDKDGYRAIKKATIILPPAAVSKHTEESVFTALVRAIKEIRGFEPDEQEMSILQRLVHVVNSPSLEVAAMLHTVQAQGERCLVAIADASRYRDSSLELSPIFGALSVRVDEDRWTPHVVSICRQVVPIVKELTGYGLVHVPEIPAQKPSNTELLLSVEDCYVMTLHYKADPEEVFNSRAQAWRSMVLQDRLPEVMTEIENLALPESARLHALAQLLRGTGRDSEMLDVIAQLQPHLAALEAKAAIQVALLAHQAGATELADDILPEEADGIDDQLWLEEALELATHLEDNGRIDRFDACLAKLFPQSERLRENRDRRLLMNFGRVNSGQSHIFTTAGFSHHHVTLQQRLSGHDPDYESAIEEARAWGQGWLEFTVVCCAMHARSIGKPIAAAEIASIITSSNLYGRQATQILLWSIKSMLLRQLVPTDDYDHYRQLFLSAFRFLAHHPEDNGIRLGLTTLLSVESCGDMGIPLVALTVLELAQQGARMARQCTSANEATPFTRDDAIETSIKNGFTWLGELCAGEPGVTLMPRDLLIANPDDVVRTIGGMLHHSSGQHEEDGDLEFQKKLVLLACAICPHAIQMRNDDIRLMRHLASKLATLGQYQQARDFAEQILLMGQANAYRRRLAWQAFGDIYHRCRNHIVALVSLSCAMAIDVEIEKQDLWHEVYSIHRVLRDLGLFEISRLFLPAMKTLLSDLGFDADEDPRYVSAELSLRLMETQSAEAGVLGDILAEVAEACQKELGDPNRLLPLAVLLGQTVLKAEDAGVNVPSEIQAILDTALSQIGASMAGMVRTVSTAKPVAKDVLEMFNSVERAVYALDASRDYAALGLAARRLLDPWPQDESTARERAFAVELLADHTVSLVGDAPVMTLEWPTQYAMELNQAGLDVAFLALDSEGELTVTHVSGGHVRTIEQPKLSENFQHRFHAWLRDYPKDYGLIDRRDGNNIFYVTMERLGIKLPQSERLVLVAEPFLQQLTANLVVLHPEDASFEYFAGMKMAIGIVPSLSWLSTACAARHRNRTAYKAWISAEPSPEFGETTEGVDVCGSDQEGGKRESTLDVALRRLNGCLVDYGFVVDTGRRLPRDMNDAGLVVVTAHGGLNREGRYLHCIRDDEDLIEAPSALAAALAEVELVILFVCSGGRIDKNPWDNSTTSLPKQLLNKGCRAVIASPWPLDVMVTYNWLEPFLQEWEAGATVLAATKKANDAVAHNLGDAPQYSLAMCVYGNVLLTKPAPELWR